uniref:ATP synthase F0 subunit 8 n=1 Tax=Plectrocnemia tortosa TaxID=623669 RepID=A0A9E8LP73_9NEOP|nr:ATP synthase F0 subunit 8 [Plectrocnemia tortosa]UZZ44263.1 ATP synthase F0 subunit 8 [Plectrocnemia tortosa]
MPQMYPSNWIFLMFYYMMIMLIYMSLVYYMNINKIKFFNKKKINSSINNLIFW